MMQRGGSNYSWWWASHIRTRQSKWLEQNLQDMEEKVKTMLKLIEEDGDSFAKRAEMYYRKRPELINFVEEFFRGYRALAERYDHISGELHSANNTIATVFPDQVKFPIDEDDLKIPPEIDPNKFCNGLPETPQLMNSMKIDAEIPKFPNQLGEMMRSSGMDRDTVEEIERIEKSILVLQAEKEIVKNSYEAGLAKFWEIEKQVMELQEKARCLQEGFEFGSTIKEEEAEALMVATALKSCGETLARLQEQQQRSEDEAKIESKRIQNAEDKLEILKGEFILSETEFDKLIDEAAVAGTNITNLEDEISNVKQERLELQEICRKIREQFQLDSDKSLYVPEIGEKIDELVNKVSGIETLVLSQTAQITRLRSETDELQKHLQSLEDEKLELVNESEKLDKIRDLEGKLQAVQDLYCCIVDQKNQLQNNLSEACHNLDVLAEKLLGSEMQEEKTDTHLVETGSENKNPLKFESDEKITDHEQSFESEKREPKAIDQPENSAPFLDLQKPSIEQVLSFESWKKNIEFEEPKLIKGRTDPNERTMIVGSDEQNPNLEEGVLKGESEKQSKEPEQSVTDFESWKKNIEFEEPKLEKGRTDANERTMIVESDEKNPNREESVINGESEKQSKEPEDLENLHLLLLDHLEDREKILLSEYTAILRNYKETKRKLSDIEKQNEETQIATMAEIRDLKSSNAMKDGEIQLLRQKMNLLRLHSDEIPEPDELDQIVNKSKTPFYRLETETNQSDPEVQTFQNQRQKKRSRWYFLTRRALFRRSKRHSEEALASSG